MLAAAFILAHERRWRRFFADSTGQDNVMTGAKAVLPESHHPKQERVQLQPT
jgi:hypothetical protein